MNRSLLIATLFASIFSSALALSGCRQQQEGERCSRDSGNDDCASGLVCKEFASVALCCPETGSATTKECTGAGLPNNNDAGGAAGSSAGSGGSGGSGNAGTGGTAGAGGTAGEAGSAGDAGESGSAGSGATEGCTPGDQKACACIGSSESGAQVCQDDNTWGECQGCPDVSDPETPPAEDP